ncbi:MAG: IS607 family transposase [Crocosphaera sp.]|nr:IS607 family transposase [Crocosphaera sp.]
MPSEELLNITQTAKILGVSVKTLQRWDKEGTFPALRTPSNRRAYRRSDVNARMGINDSVEGLQAIAVYCRVSSQRQKDNGDLDRQQSRVITHCTKRKYNIKYVLAEMGSGMNDKRPKLNRLLNLAIEKQISKVVIEYKDRLTRFNFNLFDGFFKSHGVEIEWVEESLPKSYEDELVEDLISIMSSFSAKMYGRRSAVRRKRDAASRETSDQENS